jgi:biopolymer transport protein ExbD
MAGTLRAGRKGIISDINVTPMVDIMLVLLVIMMVSATYIVAKSLRVQLPKAASGADIVNSVAKVTLTKKGELFFNQAVVTEPELVAQLKSAKQASSEVNLIVSADREVQHGQVVHVIDVARGLGIDKFAINVETKK